MALPYQDMSWMSWRYPFLKRKSGTLPKICHLIRPQVQMGSQGDFTRLVGQRSKRTLWLPCILFGARILETWMLNSAYITPIQKNTQANQVKDFRPISLVHSFAKLVTKILANRLARHWTKWFPPIKVRSSRSASYRTISCWSRKLRDFCTLKGSHGSYSNWTLQRPLTRCLGLFS